MLAIDFGHCTKYARAAFDDYFYTCPSTPAFVNFFYLRTSDLFVCPLNNIFFVI